MDLTVIVIKPDAVRDCLEGLIMDDFMEQIELNILFAKYHRFTFEQVELIYPDWVTQPVFPFMVKNLTFGESLIVLVQGDDSSRKIAKLKGKMNKGGGLRHKYCLHKISQMDVSLYSEDELEALKAENRMHSTDFSYEALEILNLVCSNSELLEISKHFSEVSGDVILFG